MAKTKKKKSQAPVALVYFLTLLLFMAIFAFIATKLLKKVTFDKTSSTTDTVRTDHSFSLMFARTNQMGSLCDVAVYKVIPEENHVIIVPLPAETVDSSTGKLFKETYISGGITNLKQSVEQTLNISIDHYVTVSEGAFESIFDIIGGVIFTPSEELYRISENDDEADISYRAGIPVELTARQARILLASGLLPEGKKSEQDLFASILNQLTVNAFQQATLTKNSLDNIFNKLVNGGQTDYTNADYRENKPYLTELLDKNIKPVLLKKPDGEWKEDDRFVIAQTFMNELAEVYGIKAVNGGAALTADDASQTD
ncbi:MAG: LCP family protein [Ruminococcus sp.]|nr:LCP family protein [Ruminococcus sp.]